jgi:hypothetical protein
MRSLLLASAAVLLTTGIACAQMSSPAAAGSAGEPVAQPGAPAGQDAVTNRQSASTQTGTMGQKAADSNMGSMGSGSHHWADGAMPENGDARTYLRIARMDIRQHDRAGADEALSRAETRVLTRSVPADGSMTDASPMVTAIENARQAVNAGNYQQAGVETDMAMHHHMSGGMGMGTGASDTDAAPGNANMPSPHAIENGNNPNAAAASGQQQ